MNALAHSTKSKKTIWQDRNVVVVGAGVSGVAAAHLLLDCGAEVTLTDTRPESEIPTPVELIEPVSGKSIIQAGPNTVASGRLELIPFPQQIRSGATS